MTMRIAGSRTNFTGSNLESNLSGIIHFSKNCVFSLNGLLDDNKLEKAPPNGAGFLQATTKLDMEPNPFEQSFSGMTSEQQAAATAAAAAANGGNLDTNNHNNNLAAAAGISSEATNSNNKPVLPPIESMSGRLASPQGNDPYGWDAQSLRMGPLSPSMLEGPQNPVSTVFTTTTVAGPQVMPVVVDNGFPFPTTTSHAMPPPPPNMYNQPMPIHSQQPQQQQPPPGGPRPHSQHQNQQQQQQYAHHSGDYNNNLHLLSQATQQDMWVKRESMDGGGITQNHNLQQQRLGHAPSGPGLAGMAAVAQRLQQVQQQPPQQLHQQQQLSNKDGGVDSGLAHRVRKVGLDSEDFNSEDSDRSRQSSEGANHNNNTNGKKRPASEDKMDDEEKRKNFLERNRQGKEKTFGSDEQFFFDAEQMYSFRPFYCYLLAALKCRQRKKQWLSNLQAKVEYLSTDNDHLQAQTAALRDEVIHLKALLLAHKDCPVAQSNGVYAETIGVPNNNMNNLRGHVVVAPSQGQALSNGGQRINNNMLNGGHRPPQMQTGGGGGVDVGLAVGGHPNVHNQTQAGMRY